MTANNSTPSDTAEANRPTLSPDALARRQMLLKGLGKGSVVLAATVPLQTLAGQSLLTFDGKHQCSVSGMHSGVHSATPTNTPVCGGYSPGWWKQVNDAGTAPRRTWPLLPNGWTYNTKCSAVFSLHPLSGNPTLFEVMRNFPNTDEYHWICAWLNALSQSFNFPYTGQEVLDFYYSPSQYADALAFFKTYMENR